MLPSALTIRVLYARPTSVPTVSNMLTSKSDITTIAVRVVNSPSKLNLQKTGPMLSGIATGNQWAGIWVTPMGIPMIVVAMMLRNKAPFTFLAMSTPLKIMPIVPRIAVGVNLPRVTKVAVEETIRPEFFNPMKAINMPMPTDMAWRRLVGMALRMASRTLKKVMIRNISPSISMMASDCCHV